MLPLLEMFKDGEAKTTTQMYAELAEDPLREGKKY